LIISTVREKNNTGVHRHKKEEKELNTTRSERSKIKATKMYASY
jgi:hypothetical protein